MYRTVSQYSLREKATVILLEMLGEEVSESYLENEDDGPEVSRLKEVSSKLKQDYYATTICLLPEEEEEILPAPGSLQKS